MSPGEIAEALLLWVNWRANSTGHTYQDVEEANRNRVVETAKQLGCKDEYFRKVFATPVFRVTLKYLDGDMRPRPAAPRLAGAAAAGETPPQASPVPA